jgi:hypothetical protein
MVYSCVLERFNENGEPLRLNYLSLVPDQRKVSLDFHNRRIENSPMDQESRLGV